MTVELRLLGGVELRVDGVAVASVGGAAATRLLAFLALNHGVRHHRAHVAAMLSPDSDEERARRKLSNALHSLRNNTKQVDGELVLADRTTIELGTEVDLQIDVQQFEVMLKAVDRYRREGSAIAHLDDLRQALSRYRGDLLPGHYDDWIDTRRRELREQYLLARRLIVELERSDGQYDLAIVNARRLVDETPFAEDAHAELMRLYRLTGRRREACEQFEHCRRLLADELGVTPGAELVELMRRINLDHDSPTTMDPFPARGDTGPGELIGRSDERARLIELVDATGAGGGGLALVEGATGLGKTRLLAEVADAAMWRGATVLWAAHGVDRPMEPYGGLGRALGVTLVGLRREQVRARLDVDTRDIVARLLPGIRGGDDRPARSDPWASPEERWRLQEAVVQTLLALGASSPTLLVVEDVHAADIDTVELLRLLAPRVAMGGLAVMVTYRRREAQQRSEVWSLLTEIERRHRVPRVALRPLSVANTAELLRAALPTPTTDGLAARVHQATGGNPMFTLETAHALVRSIERSGITNPTPEDLLALVDIEASGSLDRIIDILLAELDAAPPVVRFIVAALAVWDTPASSSTLGELIDIVGLELLDGLGEAIESGFVAESDETFSLRFGHLAAAARAHTDDLERVTLHRRAAALLECDPSASAGDLARHHRAGASWSAAAEHEYLAATRAARLHSYEVAAHYHALALDSLDRTDRQPAPRQLFDHEQVLDILGRRLDQSDVLDRLEATKELSAEDWVATMHRRAALLASTDHMIDAIRQATAAIGYALTQGIDWSASQVTLARVLIDAGHPRLARSHLRESTSGALATIEQARTALALGFALSDTADWGGAAEQLAAALEHFESMGDSRGRVEALAAIAVLHAQTGEVSSATENFEAAIELARRIGHRYGEAVALGNLAALHQLNGNAAAALARSDEAIEVFALIGQRRGEAMVRANTASLWHDTLGDDLRAEREASSARRTFEDLSDDRRQAICLTVLGTIRRRRRAFALSRRLLGEALTMLAGSGDLWLEVQVSRSLAWTELDAGRFDAASDAIDRAESLAQTAAIDVALPSILALKARIAAATGHGTEAVELARRSRASEGDGESPDLGHVVAWWRHEIFALADCTDEARDEITLAHERLDAMLAPFPSEVRDLAISAVPEHRRIVDRYGAFHVQVRHMTLPAGDGMDPTLQVEVALTVHHPDDLAILDKRRRRHGRLGRILDEAHAQGGHARLKDLAEVLDTSLATVKRDLAEMRLDPVRPIADRPLQHLRDR